MKVRSAGVWIAAAVFLVIIAWQVGQAVLFGRMTEFVDEDEDYIFFFENPFYFIVQFLVLVGVGYAIVHYARKKHRRDRRRRMDV